MYQSPSQISTVFATAGAVASAVMVSVIAALAGPQPLHAADAADSSQLRARPTLSAVPELKARLEPDDELAALQAVDIALTQIGDGATYVWRRGHGRLDGSVRMTSTFRDVDGRICRHLQLSLRSGTYQRRTEGIACRSLDGVWDLEG